MPLRYCQQISVNSNADFIMLANKSTTEIKTICAHVSITKMLRQVTNITTRKYIAAMQFEYRAFCFNRNAFNWQNGWEYLNEMNYTVFTNVDFVNFYFPFSFFVCVCLFSLCLFILLLLLLFSFLSISSRSSRCDDWMNFFFIWFLCSGCMCTMCLLVHLSFTISVALSLTPSDFHPRGRQKYF